MLRSTHTGRAHRTGDSARVGAPSAVGYGGIAVGGLRSLLRPNGGKRPPEVQLEGARPCSMPSEPAAAAWPCLRRRIAARHDGNTRWRHRQPNFDGSKSGDHFSKSGRPKPGRKSCQIFLTEASVLTTTPAGHAASPTHSS